MEDHRQKSIKDWAEDDRPREKLLAKGHRVLSDAELLAIIMGSGSRDESAVALAKRMLHSVENNWNFLSRLSVEDLCRFKGIGPAKAVSIITALEIGRRRSLQDLPERMRVNVGSDAFKIMAHIIGDLNVEEFWVLYLNHGNYVIHKESISRGGIDRTAVDVRIIIGIALEKKATGIVLAHNHPSGNIQPSAADKHLTQKIKEAARLFNIDVLDHIIVAQKNFYSFASEGRL